MSDIAYANFTMLDGYWAIRLVLDAETLPDDFDPERDYEPLPPGTPVEVDKADGSTVEAYVDEFVEIVWGYHGLEAIYTRVKRQGRRLRAATQPQRLPDLWGASR